MLRQIILSAILLFAGITSILQTRIITYKFDLHSVAIFRTILKDASGSNSIGTKRELKKQYEIRNKHQIHYLFHSVLTNWVSSAEENEIEDFFLDSLYINPEDWSARGGNWDFSRKIIKATGFIGHNKAYYKRRVYNDFIYEVKYCKIAEDGTLGILFRYNEKKDEGYLLHFWPHGGCNFELIKGGQTRLRKVNVSQPIHQIIGTNVWNTLKIIAHGSKFEIYLNSYLLDTILDSQFSSGSVGLYVGGDPRQVALFEVTLIEAL